MKYEWKKQDKALYQPAQRPELLTVPPQTFFVVGGRGDPNSEAFAEAVGVLYALSYGVKMQPKQGVAPQGYFDYAVFPLEGVWTRDDSGDVLDKSALRYQLMMRQPDFVTPVLAAEVLERVKRKKPHPLLDSVRFETWEDGLSVQRLHVGPYDSEPASFAEMDAFCAENGLRRTEEAHREIYLNDARKTALEKLRTVLRYRVARV